MGNKETLCWTCKNAYGGCKWSDYFEPVEGWEATKTYIDHEDVESYLVNSCPLYKRDKVMLTAREASNLLGVSERTIHRWPKNDIVARLKKRGFKVTLVSTGDIIIEKW